MILRQAFFFWLLIIVGIFSCRKRNEWPTHYRKDLNGHWEMKALDSGQWLPAIVPGNVHMDLFKNGMIPEPFFRDNLEKIKWVEKQNWVYRKDFMLSPNVLHYDYLLLTFKGLDTYADIFLNGHKVFTNDNMFLGHQIYAKHLLRPGKNTLEVYFQPPQKFERGNYPKDGRELVIGNGKRNAYSRRAIYQYGLEWSPRLFTTGIWQDVGLEGYNKVRMQNLHFVQQKLTSEEAKIRVTLEVEAKRNIRAVIRISNEKDQFETVEESIYLNKGINRVEVNFKVENPKLWWPNGLGEAYLYHVKIETLVNGIAFDKKEERIGLRTIELVEEKDKYGKSFFFRINGWEVFIKGATFVPVQHFLGVSREEHYQIFLKSAADANLNMIRLPAEGIYEKELFYDLCDEMGLMVWQDFLFSKAFYPTEESFLNRVEMEVHHVIKRLRNHPSLAIWCGNNGLELLWKSGKWKEETSFTENDSLKLYKDYQKLFEEFIPNQISTLDTARAYIASSPSSNWKNPNELKSGDIQFNGVGWDKRPFSDFKWVIGRFMNAYGFPSFPSLSSLQKFTNPQDWSMFSKTIRFHQGTPPPTLYMEDYLIDRFRKPIHFASHLFLNQILQAEGMKIAFEAHRRAKPFCMGSIYQQLNDCWPAISRSSIDYYGQWKALHYFVKKAFTPMLVSFDSQQDTLKVYVISDLRTPQNVELNLRFIDFGGKEYFKEKVYLKIPANSSKVYLSYSKKELLNNKLREEVILIATLRRQEKLVSENHVYFAPIKTLNLKRPGIQFTVKPSQGGYTINLLTPLLAKNVYLRFEDNEGFFSDNFFDLFPGEDKSINLRTSKSLSQVKDQLQITSLYDNYQ
ncbi:beta-mannosidase [Xanthovirga aplysinae]|uniref:beta-mannosidase n=1 Tax=Xanthovirga aplysinae TaxID=2529853 RepID=UPI0012BC0EEF|nr:glycoside hydrolase family 2 protein [Xanthovirga aplysinae]MTI33571.1 glycoside hydrolase family 2 protein [Xanthovirga aplysinae]